MKGLLFVIALVGFFGFSDLNAQCAKAGASCCAKKATSTSMVSAEDISKAAAMDKTIVARKADDGTVTYQRKSKDVVTGKKMYTDVTYDGASAKFVNSESGSGSGKACAGEVKGKSCVGEGSKAKGACCAKKGSAEASVTPVPASDKTSTM